MQSTKQAGPTTSTGAATNSSKQTVAPHCRRTLCIDDEHEACNRSNSVCTKMPLLFHPYSIHTFYTVRPKQVRARHSTARKQQPAVHTSTFMQCNIRRVGAFWCRRCWSDCRIRAHRLCKECDGSEARTLATVRRCVRTERRTRSWPSLFVAL